MGQQFAISAEESKKARVPHDILLVNLIFNHILVFVACLASSALLDYIFIVPIASIVLLTIIFIGAHRARSRAIDSSGSWYVSAHWQLCARRSRMFLIALAILAGVFILLYWIADGRFRPQHWALAGAAGFPVMATVLALIVMESDALHQAKAGLLPNWVREKFPHNAAEPVAEKRAMTQNEDMVKS